MADTRTLATSAQVAEYLGIPPRTLSNWAYQGYGPAYAKIGRHRRYRWSDVEAWVTSRTGVAA